jgi:hypothetical protein
MVFFVLWYAFDLSQPYGHFPALFPDRSNNYPVPADFSACSIPLHSLYLLGHLCIPAECYDMDPEIRIS